MQKPRGQKEESLNRNFNMGSGRKLYDELIAYVDHKVKRRELDLNKERYNFGSCSASRPDHIG